MLSLENKRILTAWLKFFYLLSACFLFVVVVVFMFCFALRWSPANGEEKYAYSQSLIPS